MLGANMKNINKYYHSVVEHPELLEWELNIYKKLITNNDKSLLDLGCGAGEFLRAAKKFFRDELGVDINPDAVRICKKKNIPVVLADATNTKLKANSFDVVRAMNLIEHLPDVEKLILEARRLLKKNGYLVLHAPTQWSILYPVTNFYDDYTHVKPISKHGLERLMSDTGFEIVHLTGYTLGRNRWETLMGKVLGKIFPFSWFLVARKKLV